jgi:cell division transport system permease protein
MKLSSFNYLMKQGVNGIRKNKLMSFASFCIMLVSLLMVGLSVLVTINVNRIISGIEDKNEVVIVINDGVSQEEIDALGEKLKNTDNVMDVSFFSKDQALEQVKNSMPEEQRDLFLYFESNPMPDTYRIRIEDISKMTETTRLIQTFTNVNSVKVPTEFADILVSFRTISTVISSVLIVALVVVCIVIVSNATRTSVFSRRKEINIMKYVGATNTFIRIPFFIEGVTLGLFSSLIALLITKFVYDALQKTLTANYAMNTLLGTGNILPFKDIVLYVALSYVAAGVLLGTFGTVSSTKKHLRV